MDSLQTQQITPLHRWHTHRPEQKLQLARAADPAIGCSVHRRLKRRRRSSQASYAPKETRQHQSPAARDASTSHITAESCTVAIGAPAARCQRPAPVTRSGCSLLCCGDLPDCCKRKAQNATSRKYADCLRLEQHNRARDCTDHEPRHEITH